LQLRRNQKQRFGAVIRGGEIELIQAIEHDKACSTGHRPVRVSFSPSGKYLAIGQYNYHKPGVITVWKNNADYILQGEDKESDQNQYDQVIPFGERVKERKIDLKVRSK